MIEPKGSVGLSILNQDKSSGNVYAEPHYVSSLDECWFYHSIDLPGYGTVRGDWDLRQNIDKYLGKFDCKGKRVLEIGSASGFVCFHMERQGAHVVAYDLSPDLAQHTDVVPFADADPQALLDDFGRTGLPKLNNSYWFSHRVLGSAARVVYGTAYQVPAAIGSVDAAVFGCVLLHLRDPFRALASALRLVRNEVVIVEPTYEFSPPTVQPTEPPPTTWLGRVANRLFRIAPEQVSTPPAPPILDVASGLMAFRPDFHLKEPKTTWWGFTPTALCRMIGVLGFEDTEVTYHTQTFGSQPVPMFTIHGRRRQGKAVSA